MKVAKHRDKLLYSSDEIDMKLLLSPELNILKWLKYVNRIIY